MEHESAQTRNACFALFQETVHDVIGSSKMSVRECNTTHNISFNSDESGRRRNHEVSSCAATCHSTGEFVSEESFECRAWKRLTGMIDSVSDSISETVENFYRRVDEEMKRSVVYNLCRELCVSSPALVPVVHQHSDVDLSHVSTVSSISNGSFEHERSTSTIRTYSSPYSTPTPSYLRSLGDDDERFENSPLRSDYSITLIDLNKTMTSTTYSASRLEPRHRVRMREFLEDVDGTKIILTPSPRRNKALSESPFMAELFRSDVEPFE
mmetsp:Transcript_8460/g.13235  ORF Transcript_8460/g.13235 Transcript_8460/m.13235 type:complete len:268 (+) Transcript_8460:200-1003(+)